MKNLLLSLAGVILILAFCFMVSSVNNFNNTMEQEKSEIRKLIEQEDSDMQSYWIDQLNRVETAEDIISLKKRLELNQNFEYEGN